MNVFEYTVELVEYPRSPFGTPTELNPISTCIPKLVPSTGIIHVYQDVDPIVPLAILVVKKLYATIALPKLSKPPDVTGIFCDITLGNDPLVHPE